MKEKYNIRKTIPIKQNDFKNLKQKASKKNLYISKLIRSYIMQELKEKTLKPKEKYNIRRQIIINEKDFLNLKQKADKNTLFMNELIRFYIEQELKERTLGKLPKEKCNKRRMFTLCSSDYQTLKAKKIFISKFIRLLIAREIYNEN